MSKAVRSKTPIITEDALRKIFAGIIPKIRVNPCRSILFLSLAAENTHFHAMLDVSPNQIELLDARAALATAKAIKAGKEPDPIERRIIVDIKTLWSQYDYDELVLCVISFNNMIQIIFRPKPEIRELHEHPTGRRRETGLCLDAVSSKIRACVSAEDFAPLEVNVVVSAAAALALFFDTCQVSVSDGIDHAYRVFMHVWDAINYAEPLLKSEMRLAVGLAALLCTADAKHTNIAREATAAYPHADQILTAALADHSDANKIKAFALEAIGLVPACSDGEADLVSYLFYPSIAVWLETLGEPGVVRCWEQTLEARRPLFDEYSPTPKSVPEAFAHATPERCAAYREQKESRTMIDYYFDNILYQHGLIAHHGNEYFALTAAVRIQPFVEVCMASRPKQLETRLEIARTRVNAGVA